MLTMNEKQTMKNMMVDGKMPSLKEVSNALGRHVKSGEYYTVIFQIKEIPTLKEYMERNRK